MRAPSPAHPISPHGVVHPRGQGSREFATGLESVLRDALASGAVPRVPDFRVLAGGMQPLKLSRDLLEALPPADEHSFHAGLSALLSMTTSPYDSVCTAGCTTVARLADDASDGATTSTTRRLFASPDLVHALLDVIAATAPDPADDARHVPLRSPETRAVAAMTLATLTSVSEDAARAVTHSQLWQTLLAAATAPIERDAPGALLFLRRYRSVFTVARDHMYICVLSLSRNTGCACRVVLMQLCGAR